MLNMGTRLLNSATSEPWLRFYVFVDHDTKDTTFKLSEESSCWIVSAFFRNVSPQLEKQICLSCTSKSLTFTCNHDACFFRIMEFAIQFPVRKVSSTRRIYPNLLKRHLKPRPYFRGTSHIILSR